MPRHRKAELEADESYHRSQLLELKEILQARREDLGISQSEMARRIGIKQWDIWRIEDTDHKFAAFFPKDPTLLRAIANEYRIDLEYLNRMVFGIEPTTSYYNPLLVSFRLVENQLYQQRLSGHPFEALRDGYTIAHELRQAIRQVSSSDADLADELGMLLVGVLSQIGLASGETCGPWEHWFDQSPLKKMLPEIEEEIGLPEFTGLWWLYQGDSCYIAGRYEESSEYLKVALQHIETPDLRLDLHWTIAMNRAGLDDVVGFQQASRTVWGIVQNRDFDHVEKASEALQGLMRGAVILDMPDDARKASETNVRLLKGMKEGGMSAPIRRLQFIRAELELVNRFKCKKTDALLRAGSKAYRFARKRYPRLASQIQDALHA